MRELTLVNPPRFTTEPNKFYLLSVAAATLLCARCTKTQTTLSDKEQTFNPPIMGWSSWNVFRVDISEDIIKHQADLMVKKGLKDAGYQYINVDDGFFGKRDDNGVMHTHKTRFPNGMKPVADHIHGLGMKAGIYTDAGNNTCGSIWDNDAAGVGAGIYGHEPQDAQLYFGDWGFDFIKIDYCGGDVLGLNEKERYTSIRNSIDKVKKDVSVNICRWAYPGTWVSSLARSWRISGDINPSWESVKYIIDKNLYLSAFAGNGHYNDMDMLEIGRGLKPEEEETHFGMWCIMSSPLLIGCDLTAIPASSLQLLKNKELIALNQDLLGLQAYVVQHEHGGYVLVKDIEEKRGTIRAVALYNPTEETCSFRVPLSVLELEGTTRIRDLVKQKDERSVTDFIQFDVLPHGTKILRVEGERRMEPTRYEAEQAYLNQFDDLAKRKRGIAFMPFETASGGMTITNLGGHKDNYAQWNEVFSEQGGTYQMTVQYIPAEKKEREISDRRLEVTVNGNMTVVDKLETDRSKGIAQTTFTVNLQKGYNVIRIGSRFSWSPDLDCFTLTPVK